LKNETKFSGEGGGCGITDEVIEWMEKIQNSAEPDASPKTGPSAKQKEPKPNVAPWNGDQESPGHKYSREANEPSHRRPRRATRSKENNTCSLFIQTDPLIWRHISEQVRAMISLGLFECSMDAQIYLEEKQSVVG